MDNKERFTSIFKDNIHRDGANALLEWLEKTDFFVAPASTRFHGNYAGGLVEHSLNVYDSLKNRIDNARASGMEYAKSITDESVAIVSLLHDLCKVSFYKPGTRNVKQDGKWTVVDTYEIDEAYPFGDHADKSIILIMYFMKLLPDEIYSIRAHMGSWDSAARGGSRVINTIFDKCKLAVDLHIADTEATYIKEK